MQAGTHSLAGILAGLALSTGWHLEPTQVLMLAGAAALGALLPDIDHPASTVGRRVKLISVPTAFVFHHRGFTHSLVALALVAAVALHYQPVYGAALAFGYATHLLTDGLTRNGIRLLWPAKSRIYLLPRPLRLKTGGVTERVLFLALLIVFVWRIYELRTWQIAF